MRMVVYQVGLIFTLVAAVSAFIFNDINYPECAPPGSVVVSRKLPAGTMAPPIPDLGKKFQVTVEGNTVNTSVTNQGNEYFDGYRHLAAVEMIQSETVGKSYYILFYEQDRAVHLSTNGQGQRTCDIKSLVDSTLRTNFESAISTDHLPKVSSAAEAMHMAKSNGLTYIGKSMVRGIKTDHWQSCMRWDFYGHTNFTMDLYFTDEGWTTAYNHRQLPVQTVFNFVYERDVYSYTNFKELNETDDFDIPDPFQIPEDIVCTGLELKNGKTIPSFPDNQTYVFEQEIVKHTSNGKQSVTVQKVWHDSTHKLLRLDHENENNEYMPCSKHATREIHDFTTGRVFCMDDVRGHCSVQPVQKFVTVENGVVRMQNVSELLYVSSPYQYRGQKAIRSMDSDVFVANYDIQINGQGASSSVVTHFFSQDSPDHEPLRIDVRPIGSTDKQQYNVYNFQATTPTYHDFDITICFHDDELEPLKIVFKGITNQQALLQVKPDVLTAIVDAVVMATNVTHIRVQKAGLKLTFPDTATFSCLLAGPPPYVANRIGHFIDDHVTLGRAMDKLQQHVASGNFNIPVKMLRQNLTATSMA